MIQFSKVSREAFLEAAQGLRSFLSQEKELSAIYDSIQLPKRSTVFSAGYDFFLPADIVIPESGSVVVPTGIRCLMPVNAVLLLAPRSGQGFKTGVHLANTVGIIDSDYYYADNEGHIMVKLVNDSILSGGDIHMLQGKAFCQGVFLNYLITDDDDAEGIREGGFGSTDQKS